MGKISSSTKLFLFVLLSIVGFSNSVKAQCASNTQSGPTCTRSNTYYGEVVPNAGCGVFTSVVNYSPGSHFRIPVLSGGCYSVSTCGASTNTQILAFQGGATTGPFAYNDDNGPLCTGTAASINMVPSFTDYARVDVRESNCLAGGTSSITVRVRQNNNLVITSSGAAMCTGDTRTLTATPAKITVVPQPNSGSTGTFSGFGVSGTTYTAPLPSTSMQAYGVTYNFGYCSTTQMIDVYRAPSAAVAGNDFSVCSDTAYMNGNSLTYGTGTWSIISGPGVVLNPTAYNAAVTGLIQGQTTTLRYTASNGPCTPNSDTVLLYREFAPSAASASPDQAICATSTTVTGNAPTVGTGQWYLLSGSGTITNPTSTTTTITAIGPGVNLFVWSINNGVCVPKTDTVVITRDVPPTNAFAGPDIQLCGSSVALAGNMPTIGNGIWSIQSGGGAIAAPGNPNSMLNSVPVGTTVLTWSISNGACPASIDTITVTRSNSPASPTVTGNIQVCAGNQTLLTANSAATIPNYTWWDAASGGTVLASTASFSTPPVTGTITYYVDVQDASTTCTSTRVPVVVTMVPNPVVNLGPDRTICNNDTTCFTAPNGLTGYIWSTGDTVSSICTANSGDLWIQVTDANNCIGRDTVLVNFIPAPTVSLGADTGYCQGSNVTIGGFSGTNTYLWSTGATTPSISVNAAGNYSVTCTSNNGCSGSDTINIVQYPAIQAAFTVDTSFCPQVVFVDNSTGGDVWSWSFGDSQTSSSASPIHIYQGNGMYNVSLTVTGLCGSSTVSQQVPVHCLVGVQMPDQLEILLYPNPNDGTFTVAFEGLETDANISVWNLEGQLLLQKEVENQRGDVRANISIPNPVAGVYLVKMQMAEVTVTKRIMVR